MSSCRAQSGHRRSSASREASFGPAQLRESSGTGAPVIPDLIVMSDELDSGSGVAFVPAPEALPLHHTACSR
ncbi:hypothetical protein WME73_29275 [Sorangium sp. So ce302]|uniref:hypothetical protein n=1 Tax=unclassified Sorangium TaxID=2621164 RepID=UPI003F5D763D